MSNHKTESVTSGEFKILINDLNIELLKELKEFVHDTVVSIVNGKKC